MNIFIETTIHIDKIFEEFKRRSEIWKNIRENRSITSTYVLMEFKRRVILSCILLYNIFREENDRAEAERRLSKEYSGRTVKMALKILAKLDEGNVLDNEKILLRLRRYIRWQLMDWFMRDIKVLLDETECELARESVIEMEGDFTANLRCNKKLCQCNLPTFLSRHVTKIKKINEMLKTEKEFSNLCSRLEKTIGDLESLKGEKTCWALSDLIICLESPEDARIYTTNVNHFEPICRIVNKKLF